MIDVLLADDHQLVRDGIKLLLAEEPDIRCRGEASNGTEVLDALQRASFDVLILDINMPGMDGLETCKRVHADYPDIKILILSMLNERSYIERLLKNGALGYILKNAGKDELVQAIRTVYKGETFYSPEVMQTIVSSFRGLQPDKQQSNYLPKISRREKQILRLIVEEYTTQEIADQLHISFGTVETHRKNLLNKLEVRNTAGLVRVCMEYGLLE